MSRKFQKSYPYERRCLKLLNLIVICVSEIMELNPVAREGATNFAELGGFSDIITVISVRHYLLLNSIFFPLVRSCNNLSKVISKFVIMFKILCTARFHN